MSSIMSGNFPNTPFIQTNSTPIPACGSGEKFKSLATFKSSLFSTIMIIPIYCICFFIHFFVLGLESFITGVLFLFRKKTAKSMRLKRPLLSWMLFNVYLKVLKISGFNIEVRGMENLPKNGGAILASKHLSSAETIIALFPTVIPVLRGSLYKIPLVNLFLLYLQSIPVKRGGGTKELYKMLQKIKQRINNGGNVLIFPEGTRANIGEKKRFHLGFLSLYPEATIIPVATNSSAIYGRKTLSPKYKGTMIIKFLPSLPDNLTNDEAKYLLEVTIEKESEKLIEEFIDARTSTR